MLGETDACLRQGIQVRAGVALVAVGRQAIVAKRVDQDEEDVEVRALAKRQHVFDRSSRPRLRDAMPTTTS